MNDEDNARDATETAPDHTPAIVAEIREQAQNIVACIQKVPAELRHEYLEIKAAAEKFLA